MVKKYAVRVLVLISFLSFAITSCKKDNKPGPVTATPKKIGLFQYKGLPTDIPTFRLLLMEVSKIGTNTTDFGLVFDTGSGGMVLDAQGILLPSMITPSGFNFTGDSTVVDGITITSKRDTIVYGDNDATTNKVYGNLAYADVTIGEPGSGITIKRLPFFLYYKVVDANGVALDETSNDAHKFDVFGVSPQYDLTFDNVSIKSPFTYYDPGYGLTKGFKMNALDVNEFSNNGNGGTYVSDAITLGLTASDISSSVFKISPLPYHTGNDYNPVIPASVTYNSKTFSTNVLFDTGTTPFSYIEDPTAAHGVVQLPNNSQVKITASSGFNYTYTTTTLENVTYVENPGSSGGSVTVFGLEFFLQNAYLLDYTNHTLGLKTSL
ncbi:MAG: hypothetical protein ABI308_13105 [Mucilaginibacter sp.]